MSFYKDNLFVKYIHTLMTDKNKIKELLNVIQQLNYEDTYAPIENVNYKNAGQKIIIYGNGNNGKSTFIKILKTIFNEKINVIDNINDMKSNYNNYIYKSLDENINTIVKEVYKYPFHIFHFDKEFKDTNFKITDELIEDAHKLLNYPSLIIKYNLINEDDYDKIIFIEPNEDDIKNGQLELDNINNKIIIINDSKKHNIDITIDNCYNSTFEINNFDKLCFIDCRNNTFIIGENVRTIIANDIGAGPKRPLDDLLSNNFKFYKDYIINVDHEI